MGRGVVVWRWDFRFGVVQHGLHNHGALFTVSNFVTLALGGVFLVLYGTGVHLETMSSVTVVHIEHCLAVS